MHVHRRAVPTPAATNHRRFPNLEVPPRSHRTRPTLFVGQSPAWLIVRRDKAGWGAVYKYPDGRPGIPHHCFSSSSTTHLLLSHSDSRFTSHRCIIQLRPRVAKRRAALRVLGLTTHLHRMCPYPARQPLVLRTCRHHPPHPAITSIVAELSLWHHTWVQYHFHHQSPVPRGTTPVRDGFFA